MLIKNDKLIKKDKGFIDDAIIGVIHLLHGQIHSELEYMQSGDETFLKLADECRKDRTELLDLVTTSVSSETWCLNKHLLVWVGIYCELGARCMSADNIEMAKNYYNKASKYLKKFYELNKLK